MPVELLNLEYYPESRYLTKITQEVPENAFGGELNDFVVSMYETMDYWEGVGLAAPQVGAPLRMFVAKVKGVNSCFINPRFLWRSQATEVAEEGCLSLPGLYGKVRRPYRIVMEFQDVNTKIHRVNLAGLDARVVQHEYDHLVGWLFPFYKIPGAMMGFYNPPIWSLYEELTNNMLEVQDIANIFPNTAKGR